MYSFDGTELQVVYWSGMLAAWQLSTPKIKGSKLFKFIYFCNMQLNMQLTQGCHWRRIANLPDFSLTFQWLNRLFKSEITELRDICHDHELTTTMTAHLRRLKQVNFMLDIVCSS